MTPCTLLINFYVTVRQNKHKGFSKIISWQLKNTTTHHPFIFLFYAQIHRRKTSIFFVFSSMTQYPISHERPDSNMHRHLIYVYQAFVCCQVIYKYSGVVKTITVSNICVSSHHHYQHPNRIRCKNTDSHVIRSGFIVQTKDLLI